MISTLRSRANRQSVRCLTFFLAWTTVSAAWAQLPAEKIFPDSTKGFFVIRSLKELGDQWSRTRVGALMNDPIMEPFKEDLRAQIDKRMEERFGMTLDEIERLPSGEVAAGMIAIPDRMPGYVFTMDITDRREQTDDYLKRLTEKLVKTGVRRSVEKHKESEITVFLFPDRSQAVRVNDKGKEVKSTAEPIERRAYYVIKNNYLCVTDRPHLIRLICDRLDDPSQNALADVEDYRQVMKRCYDDMPEGSAPLIRWYLEPLNYGESVRVLLRGPIVEKRRSKPSVFTVLKEQGFDAIRGVGGVVGIKTENKEVVYRVFIYAKKPYKLAMRMLVFPDDTNFTPPGWMPPDLARCSMFYVDPLAIFDNFGSLFDSLIMSGEEGVWEDILNGLKVDPDGPRIDIREEIVVHLGHRVLGMSKYHLPITPQSESLIVAVELKEGKEDAMKKSLEKLFDNDTEMQKTEHQSHVLWHRVPAEDVIAPFGGPSGVPDLVSTSATQTTKSAEADADEPEPMFPDGAVTVAKGCLFVGTDLEYLKVILDRLDAEVESIGSQPDYKEIDRIFASMGVTDKPHFMQFFARTDETLRPTYELIRQGKMPQSQAVLGKAINALLVPEDDQEGGAGVRQQAIDGGKLPEFDKVKDYFGPSGLYGASEEDGYFFKGFVLEKSVEPEIGPDRRTEDKSEKTEQLEEPKIVPQAEPVPIFPVTGSVTLDGKPLTIGVVCYASDSLQVQGALDAEGRFVIGGTEGLPPGVYQVYIIGAVRESEVDGNKVSESLIHEKYTDAKTTPIRVEITETKNTLSIDLEPAEPAKAAEPKN